MFKLSLAACCCSWHCFRVFGHGDHQVCLPLLGIWSRSSTRHPFLSVTELCRSIL